ncbi:MAG: PAS domain S-box protein [Syntrophobacterales bacterium]|nr:MAG: PAS domain S-box protein [Syntrophobacterales bacterium]
MNTEDMSKEELVDLVSHLRGQLEKHEQSSPKGSSEEDLYKILAHSSQVGFYIMQNKLFRFVNRHFQKYSGYSEDEMLAMNPSSMILPEDRQKAAKNAIRMLKGQRFSPYEFRIVTGDGRVKWIMETVLSVTFKGERAILGNSMDLTERKEAGKRLEELEALESSILDAIPQAVVGLHQRRINFANNAVETIFGWHREELIGKSITMIYRNEEDADTIAGLFYSVLENQRTFITEFPCRRKDGREILCRMKASRIGERLRDRYIVVTYEDITEQKKAEEELEWSRQELRDLSAHLQSVREKESTRIARKIHDELGQSLTALQMDLSWLESRLLEETQPIRTKPQQMTRLVDTTIESVHKIMTELRPSLLDDLGLPAAIEWQTDDFQKRSGIRCKASLNCSETLINKELATTIFRIFQETLTNIARHSKATQCRVSLTEDGKELCLEVTDNGIGITREQINDHQSFGMIGMRERAHLWGGTVHVRGGNFQGTTVTVTIPLDKGDTQR